MINHPVKIFPCTCASEGLVVKKNSDSDSSFIEISFWQFGQKKSKWSWKEVIRACRYIIRKRTFWTDMVIMNSKVAKNLAYHILYLLDKDKARKQGQKLLVKLLTTLPDPSISDSKSDIDKDIKFDL